MLSLKRTILFFVLSLLVWGGSANQASSHITCTPVEPTTGENYRPFVSGREMTPTEAGVLAQDPGYAGWGFEGWAEDEVPDVSRQEWNAFDERLEEWARANRPPGTRITTSVSSSDGKITGGVVNFTDRLGNPVTSAAFDASGNTSGAERTNWGKVQDFIDRYPVEGSRAAVYNFARDSQGNQYVSEVYIPGEGGSRLRVKFNENGQPYEGSRTREDGAKINDWTGTNPPPTYGDGGPLLQEVAFQCVASDTCDKCAAALKTRNDLAEVMNEIAQEMNAQARRHTRYTGINESLEVHGQELGAIRMRYDFLKGVWDRLNTRLQAADRELKACDEANCHRPQTGGGDKPATALHSPTAQQIAAATAASNFITQLFGGLTIAKDNPEFCRHETGNPENVPIVPEDDGDDPRDVQPPEDGDDPRDVQDPCEKVRAELESKLRDLVSLLDSSQRNFLNKGQYDDLVQKRQEIEEMLEQLDKDCPRGIPPGDGDDPRDVQPPEDGDDPRDVQPPEDGDDPRDTGGPCEERLKAIETELLDILDEMAAITSGHRDDVADFDPEEIEQITDLQKRFDELEKKYYEIAQDCPEGDGDDPRDTPKPEDGDDPRDTPQPEDDDDPRDVPTRTLIIKATTATLADNQTATETGARGSQIKLVPPQTQTMAMPSNNPANDNQVARNTTVGSSADPIQGRMADNGRLKLTIHLDPRDWPDNLAHNIGRGLELADRAGQLIGDYLESRRRVVEQDCERVAFAANFWAEKGQNYVNGALDTLGTLCTDPVAGVQQMCDNLRSNVNFGINAGRTILGEAQQCAADKLSQARDFFGGLYDSLTGNVEANVDTTAQKSANVEVRQNTTPSLGQGTSPGTQGSGGTLGDGGGTISRRNPAANLVGGPSVAQQQATGLNDKLKPFITGSTTAGDRTWITITYPASMEKDVQGWLAGSTGVIKIQENTCRDKKASRNDPYFNSKGTWGQPDEDQWAIKQVGFTGDKDSAWDLVGQDAKPVVVAVIDTGLDWHHLDINWNNIWRNTDEIPDNGIDDDGNGYVDDVIGWDFFANTNYPWDSDGHGTIITGIIAADGNNKVGIAGINPYAKIMVLKALNNFGHTRASYLANAIIYAADNGARVINLSAGGPGLTDIEMAAVDYAYSKGVVIVVASGNEASDITQYGIASSEKVITVAASTHEDRRASYSNYGDKVSVAAPGNDVLSLRARFTDTMRDIPEVEYEPGTAYVGEDKRYYRASGTSFATPIVAGIASLLLSKHPDLTPDQVKSVLQQTAKDIGTPGVDLFTGYGRVDARAALAADPNQFINAYIDRVEVVMAGGQQIVQVIGDADASNFSVAYLEMGVGPDPKNWKRVVSPLGSPVKGAVLGDIPAAEFAGAGFWVLRLVVTTTDGKIRESRYELRLE